MKRFASMYRFITPKYDICSKISQTTAAVNAAATDAKAAAKTAVSKAGIVAFVSFITRNRITVLWKFLIITCLNYSMGDWVCRESWLQGCQGCQGRCWQKGIQLLCCSATAIHHMARVQASTYKELRNHSL